MTYKVRFTGAARRDITEIVNWIADHDSLFRAEYVLDKLIETAQTISELPDRGSRPRELPHEIKSNYRQVLFKPYRLIYEVRSSEIVIHLVADGRRNLQTLLMRRIAED